MSAVVIVATVAASMSWAQAAPPTNDNFADATALVEGIEERFSSIDATIEATESSCGGDNSVWFSYTSSATAEYAAYLTGSDHDTIVGKNNALDDNVRCNDDANDSYDAITTLGVLNPGDTTYVNASALSTGYVGTGSVGVAQLIPAADNFADALDLEIRAGAETAVLGLDIPAQTSEAGESTVCGARTLNTSSNWSNFVAPASGSWMFEAKSTGSLDIAVYEGDAVDDLTLLGCATDDHIAVIVDVTEGSTYRVRVGSGVAPPAVLRAEPAVTRMTAELVDADGDGSAAVVGRDSDLAYSDGEPVIAYSDDTNNDLRFAERSAGVWTDVLVDADGDGAVALAVLPSGEPAIAYEAAGELRFAERSAGVWTDVLIDANGDGTSTNVGADPSIVEFDNGDLGVAYSDFSNSELRFARRSGATWSDELVVDDPNDDTLYAGGIVVDTDGNPIVTATGGGVGNHVVGEWNGASWDISYDRADRHISELDYDCAQSNLLIDELDQLYLVWTDCNYAYTMAVSIRDTSGDWDVHEISAEIYEPTSTDFDGTNGVDSTDTFGSAWTPDGRLAVTFTLDSDDRLFYASDALVAEAGDPSGGSDAAAASLDGSASDDAFGSIVSYDWSDAPEGCEIADPAAASTSVRCDRATSGTVTLTVTDTDGLTHSDTASFEVDNSCSEAADPFTDVTGSFARDDVTCIFNLGVTTGSGPTTYAPTETVTREQMAAFLARLYEAATGSAAPVVSTPLTDIGGSFAAADIARIYGLGITTGNTPTTYDPAGTVSREQMAAFLARLYAAIEGSPAPVVVTPLSDIAGSFAAADIRRIYGLGITTGNTPTTYDPAGTVSREQMAAFLARLYLAT